DLVGSLFPDAVGLEYMHGIESSYRGEAMVVSRTGYTGEKGFELFVADRLAGGLWRELLSAGRADGLEAFGPGASDTPRLAMGYVSPRDRIRAGDRVEIEVRGKRVAAEAVRPPFVASSPK